MKRKNPWTYVLFLLIPLIVGGIAAILTNRGMPYYNQLHKPFFTPPAILFPIVWTLLYVLMGIGAARVWISRKEGRDTAIGAWILQLAMNFLWTVWFFTAHWYFLAFLWLGLLIVVIAVMTKLFFQCDKIAGQLQIPYLLWCCVAALLNFAVFLLN